MLSIASSGLAAADSRFTASAERVAGGAGDLASQLTELTTSKVALQVSIAVMKTTAELSERLLDIVV